MTPTRSPTSRSPSAPARPWSYEDSKDFEAQVIVRIQSGNPPDVAIFPQPGLLSQIVNDTGAVKPLSAELEAFAKQYFPEDWMDYGIVNDIPFGLPNNADFKSLVWYSPTTFEEKGYTVPTTWDELMALHDEIAATGTKPWCIGIGSGEATGWHDHRLARGVRPAAVRPRGLRPVGRPTR